MASCGLCNDLRKRHESHRQLSFDFTFHEISSSAKQQTCKSCVVISNGLCQIKIDSWSLDTSTISRVFARCHGEQGGLPDTLQLVVAFNDESPSLQLEFYSLKLTAWKAILPRSVLSQNPLTEEAVTWARNHLEKCNRTHVSCKERSPKQRPKRLLSLVKSKDGDMDIKLVEVKSNSSDISYAALSHCWGNERLLATTTRNLEIHKKCVNWPLIPPTFMDAIKLAMALNIGYLWIDSLCILQDDLKDWEVESSKMADIYQYASVTLAATTASSSAQGAYAELSRVSKHTEIKLPTYISKTCRIGVRERVRHWNKSTANDATQFPLLSRGWGLQERLLSSRVLHFCDTEMIWECREATDCECGALSQDSSPGAVFYGLTKRFDEQKARGLTASIESLPNMWGRLRARSPVPKLRKSWLGPPASSSGGLLTTSLSPPTRSAELKQPKSPSPTGPQTESIPEFVPHFHRLVEQYSALELTRASDRLPAFSGLAERMQHFRGAYLAGLWADSLCFDLMWRIDKHDLWATRSTRPTAYNGPSWSWVSSITAVKYWPDTINYTDTVQRFLREHSHSGKTTTPLLLKKDKTKIAIRVPGKNPFGFVESGVLTLEASAVTATLAYTNYANTDDVNFKEQVNAVNEYRLGYHADIEYGEAENGTIRVDVFADYILSLEGPSEVYEGAELTLLLVHPDVALVLKRKVEAGDYMMIDGEIAWERIGIARVTTEVTDIPGYGMIDWMKYSEVRTFKVV